MGLQFFCFDFAGCGESSGQFVSLGHFESEDTKIAITKLTNFFSFHKFVLWGRSMGAATALLVEHQFILGKIVDSPFSSIPDLCQAISKKISLPGFIVPISLHFIQKIVQGQADFNIHTVSPLEASKKSIKCSFIIVSCY